MLDRFFRSGGRKRVIDGWDSTPPASASPGWEHVKDRDRRLLHLPLPLPPDGLEAGQRAARRSTLAVGGFAALYILADPGAHGVRREQDHHRPLRRHLRGPQRHRRSASAASCRTMPSAWRICRSPDQGNAGHRGLPLSSSTSASTYRHLSRPDRERARQRRGAGRLHPYPAAGEEPVPLQRALAQAQDQGGLPRPPPGGALDQEVPKMYSTAPIRAGAFGVEVVFPDTDFAKSVRDITLAGVRAVLRPFKRSTCFAPHVICPLARAHRRGARQPGRAGYYSAGRRTPRASIRADRRAAAVAKPRLVPRLAYARRSSASPTARATTCSPPASRWIDMQRAAQEALVATLRAAGRRANPFSGAMVSMEPTGPCAPLSAGARLRREPVQPRHQRAPPAWPRPSRFTSTPRRWRTATRREPWCATPPAGAVTGRRATTRAAGAPAVRSP